jgi:hypothetical protein
MKTINKLGSLGCIIVCLTFLACSTARLRGIGPVILPSSAVVDSDSLAFVGAHWQETSLGGGARLRVAQMHIFHSLQSISMVVYRTNCFRTDIVQADKADSTSSLALKAGADFAINGSFFNMSNGRPVTYTLQDGALKMDSTSLSDYRMRCDGIVMMGSSANANEVGIRPCPREDYSSISKEWHSAMVAGPILLFQGNPPAFTSKARHPRTIIGTNAQGEVMMIVIDGRFKGHADGMTYAEMAKIVRYLRLRDVLNLDGGGSSTLWTKKKGVVNHPSDNKVFDHRGQRRVSNIVYAYKIK